MNILMIKFLCDRMEELNISLVVQDGARSLFLNDLRKDLVQCEPFLRLASKQQKIRSRYESCDNET